MVLKSSLKADIGSQPHFFELKSTEKVYVSIDSLIGVNGLMICFICNHCPYVKELIKDLIDDISALDSIGFRSVAIMSNNDIAYPEDSFEKMIQYKDNWGLNCPYLLDESQDIARLYGVQCTPEFFLYFNPRKGPGSKYKELLLKYRGALRANRKEKSLYNNAKSLYETGDCEGEKYPSIGCSLKWK